MHRQLTLLDRECLAFLFQILPAALVLRQWNDRTEICLSQSLQLLSQPIARLTELIPPRLELLW